MINIGFIGFGNHAKKLVEVINEKIGNVHYKIFNHRSNYEKTAKNFENVYALEDLFFCDAIFICTPNATHFEYLKPLIKDYLGYIFCEKPPVVDKNDLNYLENIDAEIKKRIYFNFNYRFTPYMKALKEDNEKYELGKLIHATIVQGHGFALKEDYAFNWRSDKNLHQKGVFETFSIHYIDMFISLFGNPEQHSNLTSTISPYGNSIDNSSFSCKFKSGAIINVTTSYTTPKISIVNFVFENGIIEFRSNLDDQTNTQTKYIYGPREFFDKAGFFTQPPLIARELINEEIHTQSLKESISFFVDTVKKQEKFDQNLYQASLNTNRLLFCAD